MIIWRGNIPFYKMPLGYFRLLSARIKFFQHYGIIYRKGFVPWVGKKDGYRMKLERLRNIHKGKRCFIIGNGPSLNKMDLSGLKNEITVGANAIYKEFSKWGFNTDYLLFEDPYQTELRAPDASKVKNTTKIFALYNSPNVKTDRHTLFMNVRKDKEYWKSSKSPMFSKDFPNIVYLGGTIIHIAFQLAYHLGCNPIYLIGVDFDWGELPYVFEQGSYINITKENIHLFNKAHFKKDYYKVGDRFGVPPVDTFIDGYKKVKQELADEEIKVYNAGIDSKLEVFQKVDYKSIFIN